MRDAPRQAPDSPAYDVVFVDFYGTVAAGDRAAVEGACRRIVEHFDLQMPAPEFAVRWGGRFFALLERSNGEAFQTLHEVEMSSLVHTLEPIVGAFDPAPFVAELESYWRAPDVHPDALRFIEQVDLPTCCVSNADTAALEGALDKHGIRFDAVITSEDARSYKPDEEIFHRALERMKTTPDRVLHVGDSLHSDIGGAARLGMRTAWICREDRIHDIGECQSDFTIASLEELLPILDGQVAAG